MLDNIIPPMQSILQDKSQLQPNCNPTLTQCNMIRTTGTIKI